MSEEVRLNSADSAVTQEARLLHRRGRTPVGLDGKKPTRPDWQQHTYANEVDVVAEFTSLVEGSNLGVVLGRGLADADLDCQEAIRAAPYLLPLTPRQSGRESAPRSHWWYSMKPDQEMFFQLKNARGDVVVELRADSGHQTVVPPSVHRSGEPYRWEGAPDAEPTPVDLRDLGAAVAALGLVAILAPHWPRGSRHHAYLALVGGLLRGHPDDERLFGLVEKIVQALTHLTNDEEHRARVAESLPSTRKKLQAGDGQQVTGWTTLREHVAGEHVAAAMKAADKMRECLELRVTVTEVDGDDEKRMRDRVDQIKFEITAREQAEDELRVAEDLPLVWDDEEELEVAGQVVWGTDEFPLAKVGEPLVISAGDGLGKTTIAQEYSRARLGLYDEMWGLPVKPLPVDQNVLYLAFDRYSQIRDAWRRGPEVDHRVAFAKQPVYPLRSARAGRWLLEKVAEVNAGLVVVDSLKDQVNSNEINELMRFWENLKPLSLAGVEVAVLSHTNKTDVDPDNPLGSVSGHRLATSSAGSVLVIAGKTGSPPHTVYHAKPLRGDVRPPSDLSFDHATGRTRLAQGSGLTVDLSKVPAWAWLKGSGVRPEEVTAIRDRLTAADGPLLTKLAVGCETGAEYTRGKRVLEVMKERGQVIVSPAPGSARGKLWSLPE